MVDQTGTLSGGDVAALTQTLKELETRKGSQIAVLIVPTTDQESIEQFSIRVAEAWKIGRKKIDDGALLVVAKNDRRLRIEVGYGLEGALTDATTKRIIDEDITPKFKSGDFAGGISAGVNRMIRVIDGEKLPAPEPEHWRSPGLLNNIDPFNPFVIVAVFIIGGLLRATLGRLVGSAATGGFVGLRGLAVRRLDRRLDHRRHRRLHLRPVQRPGLAGRRTRRRQQLVRRRQSWSSGRQQFERQRRVQRRWRQFRRRRRVGELVELELVESGL